MSATEATAGGLYFATSTDPEILGSCNHAHSSRPSAYACARKYRMGLAFAPAGELPDFDLLASARNLGTRRGVGRFEPLGDSLVRYHGRPGPRWFEVIETLADSRAVEVLATRVHLDPRELVATLDPTWPARAYLLGGSREQLKIDACNEWRAKHPYAVHAVERKRSFYGRVGFEPS